MTVRGPGVRRRYIRTAGLLFFLDISVTLLRVAIIVTASLALFLAAFFGYLTAPFLVLFVFIVVYAIIDRYRIRRRRALERKQEILGDPSADPPVGESR